MKEKRKRQKINCNSFKSSFYFICGNANENEIFVMEKRATKPNRNVPEWRDTRAEITRQFLKFDSIRCAHLIFRFRCVTFDWAMITANVNKTWESISVVIFLHFIVFFILYLLSGLHKNRRTFDTFHENNTKLVENKQQ